MEGPGRKGQDYKRWEEGVGVEVRHPIEWLRLEWTSAFLPTGDSFSIAYVQTANRCRTQLVRRMTSCGHAMMSSCIRVLQTQEELVEEEEKVAAVDDVPCLWQLRL